MHQPPTLNTLYRLWAALIPVQLAVIVGAIGLLVGATGAITILLLRGDIPLVPLSGEEPYDPSKGGIAPTFTPEVQFWSPYILRWSATYGVDPNILATVIQIESCGHYLVSSPVGAQ
ncbi:MAG TPA: hypothetical protein PLD47_09015, partial [Aggregatilineales bacterium]|nr:hypothetical protein [Aggregatilineales bacterium]